MLTLAPGIYLDCSPGTSELHYITSGATRALGTEDLPIVESLIRRAAEDGLLE